MFITLNKIQTASRELNVTEMKIPPGLTGIYQPADINWNKLFKSNIRNKWSKELRSHMKESEIFYGAKPPLSPNSVQ